MTVVTCKRYRFVAAIVVNQLIKPLPFPLGLLRPSDDRVSVLSGVSGRSRSASEAAAKRELQDLPWYKGLTWKDFKDILPTCLILIFGSLLMILVTPIAYKSVFVQLRAEAEVNAAEEARLAEEAERRANLTRQLLEEAAAAAAGAEETSGL